MAGDNVYLEVTIPKNTPLTALNVQVLNLGVNSNFLRSVKVVIPIGHKGLAYLNVAAPGFPIIPGSGSNVPYIRGENQEFNAQINRIIDGPPYNVICTGYNLDPFLPHTFLLYFDIGQ